MDVLGKKILVIGLGKSGISAARWLAKTGAQVTVSEIKTESDMDPHLIQEMRELGVALEMGGHQEDTFLAPDMIVLSPGVPLDTPPLTAAREKGITVLGEMELASRMVDLPIVAVTGTNGKSTVTAFIGYLLREAGNRVFVGGNIGTPLMDYAIGGWKADYAVVEVSSFQLDTMDSFRPTLSLLLNISPDHLDRYPNYEAYVQSKLKIFENQERGHHAIVNDDDALLSRFSPKGEVTLLRYGLEEREGRQAYMKEGKIRIGLSGREEVLFTVEKWALPGRHNLENLMAALLAGLVLGVDPRVLQRSIEGFRGLPHRLEFVRRIGDVDFYNDSKATNVDAAARSIASFDRPLVLIAGGRDKGGDYSPLVAVAKEKVKKAIFMGEAKDLLAKAFEGVMAFSTADSMDEAVSQAYFFAGKGDVVLLAPACSSFDMFTDYADRGKAYRRAVERLGDGE
ncbi:MAG: UDP-N-acetylmuramoyl-L-alanine--D-glutamate ligase [Proteobacteria bacterium]|nr:UDP-N-acetylmuramoyl-L-alanine--D-glutamate ligase [Pseudomonadota bacterium]